MNTLKTYLKLRNINRLDDYKIFQVLRGRGTLKGIFEEDIHALMGYGLDIALASKISEHNYDEASYEAELLFLERLKERDESGVLVIEDEDYPKLLKEIDNPPILLYYRGDKSVLNRLSVAMVGSRKSSETGNRLAFNIAKDLAGADISIVSGFAEGIDISSHLGAINGGGSTISVLANGLLECYPARHSRYEQQIVENGCFVSEFPLSMKPLKSNFLRRNRIISGLSVGVVVVESASRSGTFNTIGHALDQSRLIFAVPAHPYSNLSGANQAIKEGGTLVESAIDIVEKIGMELSLNVKSEEKKQENLGKYLDNDTKKAIFTKISNSPISLTQNELVHGLEVAPSEVFIAVSELEIDGLIIKSKTGKLQLAVPSWAIT